MDKMPLGSGALAGTTYPIDRQRVCELLGFEQITQNSLDGVSDRDFCIELCSALSILMMHLSRFSEEVILWCSWEFKFVELDDAYATGSSIMPQKKNPDVTELIRGKTGRVYGDLMTLLTMMKGISLAYDKDMQEDKEMAFDAMDTVKDCIREFTGMISTAVFQKDTMALSAKRGFTNATDAADYLVKKGVPFRDAHSIVGRLVLKCVGKGIALDDLSLDDFRAESGVFEDNIYEAISMKTCVEKRLTKGAPGRKQMAEAIEFYREYTGG
jgi:argininosuccinate lyase